MKLPLHTQTTIQNFAVPPLVQHAKHDNVIAFRQKVDRIGKPVTERAAQAMIRNTKARGTAIDALQYGVDLGDQR